MARSLPRGFTLIEMMIVVAIMGFLAVVSSPITGGWIAAAQLRTASGVFEQGVARARSVALRNPEATPEGSAAAILCRSGDRLSLMQAPDDSSAAQCGVGAPLWSADLPAGVSITVGGIAFKCLAMDNRGTRVNPASGGATDNCGAGTQFTLTQRSVSATFTPR